MTSGAAGPGRSGPGPGLAAPAALASVANPANAANPAATATFAAITAAPVDGWALRCFMRRWATGVAVVTGMADRPVGCTVTAFTSVSLDPPLLLVCLGRGSRTRAAIAERPVFGVNVLSARQHAVAEAFAAADADRFRDVPFHVVHDVPVLDEALVAVVCAVRSAVPAGDHDLLLGAPLWYRDGVGPIAPPLLHYAGGLVRTASL
ncbi:3-hydroxy-9,10-secoandrosta-1,3,5(10)-triene-9,17-dione monooxygenase reductase component [Catenulispora sp. EB89]|uniref:flavin reductase family protein n=1 Tax=Catenulispora sp. EB89 TaxID=3156257 RepID=UPI003513960F